ncbi:phosphotransferase family protein [Novosphingobium sp. G106]|uniref:phosphotransferase family protein n=1 Tax=Novosphingobium sp. G106 TaxID=2849500 RepID=UPI001C2D9C94|nr:phosphotransferase family protein [Novosphingobium sp. G106]MBV1687959.1 phosphotransferase family protein [Novosphingobium sp. G106]
MRVVTSDADTRLADWLCANAGLHDVGIGGQLAGGNANVTRLVTAREGRFVLRHPPTETVSDKAAAGISREFAAISALADHAPAPRPVAYCDDPQVIGQPFALSEFVDGVTITDAFPDAYGADATAEIGRSLMETLGTIHRVDTAPLHAQGFGKPAGFARRQIERWLKVRADNAVRDLPLLTEVGEWLLATLPAEGSPAIIHCDFHLDNCLAGRERPEVRAVIDWEMATLGDPLVDLGLCLFFWKRDPAAPLGFAFVQAISNHSEAPGRAEMAEIWSLASGRDHAALAWHIVFSAWRLAAIVEGAWVLCAQGKVSSDYARGLEYDVPNLLREAATLVEEAAR